MSKFKDIVQQDIKSVFLNIDEFADMHTIDGKEMPAVLDDFEASEREIKYVKYGDGVYKIRRLLYVAESDFGPIPIQGRTITYDGKKYIVVDAVSEGGLHAITVEATTSGNSTGRRFPA